MGNDSLEANLLQQITETKKKGPIRGLPRPEEGVRRPGQKSVLVDTGDVQGRNTDNAPPLDALVEADGGGPIREVL